MCISAAVHVVQVTNGMINPFSGYVSFIQTFFHTCNIHRTLYMKVV